MQGNRILEGRRKQLILDHLRRHAHQGHRVLVVAALIAGDIEHADDFALVIENRRGRAE